MPRHDGSASRHAETEEAHLAVDSVLALLLQYNLAVDAMQRDMSKSCAINAELLQWTESLVAESDAEAAAYARAERQAAVAAAAPPPARTAPPSSAAAAGSTRRSAHGPPSAASSATASAARPSGAAMRSPSPAAAASSRPARPLPEPSPFPAAAPAAASSGWTPIPVAGASTAAISGSSGGVPARPGRRQYAEHSSRPTLLSDADMQARRSSASAEGPLGAPVSATAAAFSSAVAPDDDTAYWSGPLPTAGGGGGNHGSIVDSDEPSGLFGAAPRVNKAKMLAPYMSGTASSASKGKAVGRGGAGSTKAKSKSGAAAGAGSRQTLATPARAGAASAGASRAGRSASTASFTPAPAPVAASPASARPTRTHASSGASPAARQPRSTPSPSPGASLRRSSSMSYGGGGSGGGVGGVASPASVALDLESILRLAGRAHVADEDDAHHYGYGAMPPPPPPPPPLVPAVPAPSAGDGARRGASGTHSMAHPSSARPPQSAFASSGPGASASNAAASIPSAAPHHHAGPHRAFTFPPDFLRDLEALKHARAQIALLDERRRAGALASLWTGEEPPQLSGPAASQATEAALAAREQLALAVGSSGATLAWESPSASLYPPPPFVPLCSFPLSSSSGGDPLAGLARPPPFKYPLSEPDLAALKGPLWEARKARAQAARQGSGGMEPSARQVEREAMRLLAQFETDRATLFGLHVRVDVERRVQAALAPVLARMAGADAKREEDDDEEDEEDPHAPSSAGSTLSTPEQLALLKLSYALLRVGGRSGPQTRFGQSRRALPTFLAADTAPPYLQSHHLWSAAEEEEEAQRMEQDEEEDGGSDAGR